ncbi:phage tail terminator-like protein [Caulobacter sp. RHG1]|uniref:phage tail terminator-like protein n=1 Tax=Caulobacter sp. (strain RHG1) TaxID=2545762 RepID=UPI001558106B|nr:phage tail terminator-like protein [Caulobacter sp. RHG1]NQE62954.1 hypothetical protein [Caulobacter sp. RHG1]
MSDPVAPEVSMAKALEAALKSIDPAMLTALENVSFTPPAVTVAYQEVIHVLATPDNAEKGGSTFLQTGYMQVILRFPGAKGKGAAWACARAIRSLFKAEASFEADGITTNIGLTPRILPGSNDTDGRYVLTVRVPFNAELPN